MISHFFSSYDLEGVHSESELLNILCESDIREALEDLFESRLGHGVLAHVELGAHLLNQTETETDGLVKARYPHSHVVTVAFK